MTTATSLPASTSAHKQQLPLSTLASASASTSFGAKMKFLFTCPCCCCCRCCRCRCCLCWPGEQTKSYANQSTLWQAKVQRTLNFQPTKLGMPHATPPPRSPLPLPLPLLWQPQGAARMSADIVCLICANFLHKNRSAK